MNRILTAALDRPAADELTQLIENQRLPEAIALCERWAPHPVVGGYYVFWLQRLGGRMRLAAGQPGPQTHTVPATHARPMRLLAQAMAEGFAAHPYALAPDEALPPPAEMQTTLDALVAASPFKGAIYLPTAKVPLTEQVHGMRRVCELARPANVEASRLRFEVLCRAVREAGVRRVFVVGNGPSLKQTDLSLLADEVTIGFNGIFLHETFTPTIYIVEDHLVAEDRIAEIHAYRCPVKMFPASLAYCIQPQDNTIFINHRSRISYPVDTDFSADAGQITYTGGTVTYTGLQVAASLGVEEIVLVGVDASYRVGDVERSDTYDTGVLTSTVDDANHFDPRYFGKGLRWHDPNVHTMLQAYRKAREHGRAHGVRLVNATLGGQLEVFPRVDFHRLFAASQVFPRLAVLDAAPLTSDCAAGVMKRHLLCGWDKSSLLHVCAGDQARTVAFQSVPHDLYAAGSDAASVWPAWRSLLEYDPEVLYLRPTADSIALAVLQAVAAAVLGKPWVVHDIDDDLARVAAGATPALAAAWQSVQQFLLFNAAEVFAGSPKLARHLVSERGLPAAAVSVVHDFDPEPPPPAPPQRARAASGEHVLRCWGRLQPAAELAVVLALARQIEGLHCGAGEGDGQGSIRLEICAEPTDIASHRAVFEGLSRTTLTPLTHDEDCVTERGDAAVNLLCCGFDPATVRQQRYALARELPRLLAAGAPLLVAGHADTATVGLLRDAAYPLLAADSGFTIEPLLQQALRPDAAAAQALHDAITRLRGEFSDETNRMRLHRRLRAAARQRRPTPDAPLVAALAVLHQAGVAAGSLGAAGDLDILLRLPLVEPAVLDPALARIRSHGREWSVQQESTALAKSVDDAAALGEAPAQTRARALATLVCSLGVERYQALSTITRDWLRHAYPTSA